MDLKNIGKYFLFLLSVPKCACCKQRLSFTDNVLCKDCYSAYEEIKTRNCSRCSENLSRCLCTNEYLNSHFVKKLAKIFRYNTREENLPANSLIYSLKRVNRSDVVKLCSKELSEAILNMIRPDKGYVITNVPRRRSAIVKYGADHSAELAKHLSRTLGIEYISPISSRSRVEQKSLNGESRIANADFYIKHDIDLTGKSIILIDDIVTTGASMGKTAMLLRALGAKSVIGACIGISYKDTADFPTYGTQP